MCDPVTISIGAAIGLVGASMGLASMNKSSSSSSVPVAPVQLQASKQASASGSNGGTNSPNRAAIAAMMSQGVKTSSSGLGAAPIAKKTALGQ